MENQGRVYLAILKISFLIQWVYMYHLYTQKEYLWLVVWVYSCLIIGSTLGNTMEKVAIEILNKPKK